MNKVEHAVYIRGPVWAERRAQFKYRYGSRCFACGDPSAPQVHHVTYTRAGNGGELDADLRVLCGDHHQLAHAYERSGLFGAFMMKGTLARATDAMIYDVRTYQARSASAPTSRRRKVLVVVCVILVVLLALLVLLLFTPR